MRRQTFEKFYLSKIALGEGCGCAELVTRTRDVEDALSGRGRSGFGGPAPSRRFRLFGGLFRRKRRRSAPDGGTPQAGA